jgi:hypothetical protein
MLSKLPVDQLAISIRETCNPSKAYVADKNSKNRLQNVIIEHKWLKEPAQIHSILLEKLKEAEGKTYQSELEKLKRDIALPESIYKAFKQDYENISKKISEIESLIVKEG